MTESQIEAKVVRWAKNHGIRVVKLNGPGDRGKPDRMFLARGTAAFIEFKAPGGKTTALQRKWLEGLSDEGFDAETFDDAVAAIDWLAAVFQIRI